MADWLTKEQRSRNMSAIRAKGTTPEVKLGLALKQHYPRRKIVSHPADIPGKPDYYLPGLKLAVFLDGCFWHACRKHGHVPDDNRDYWEPKLAGNKARDQRINRELRSNAIRRLRVWEHDVRGLSAEETAVRLRKRLTRHAGLIASDS